MAAMNVITSFISSWQTKKYLNTYIFFACLECHVVLGQPDNIDILNDIDNIGIQYCKKSILVNRYFWYIGVLMYVSTIDYIDALFSISAGLLVTHLKQLVPCTKE